MCEVPFRPQRCELRDGSLGSNAEGIRPHQDRLYARRKTCRSLVPGMPLGKEYPGHGADEAARQRLESHMAWVIEKLRDMSRGQAQWPFWQQLQDMPHYTRLEGRNHRPAELRSFQDPVSVNRRASHGGLSEVSLAWIGRPATLCWAAVRNVFQLSFRSTPRRVQAGLRLVPHDCNMEEVERLFQ